MSAMTQVAEAPQGGWAAARSAAAQAGLDRSEAEAFLYYEAELLDTWRLNEWAALFTDDGEYLIPPLEEPNAAVGTRLFLVYDDRHRLEERAKRLLKKQAHAEFPHSITRRIVGNVQVQGRDAQGLVQVSCNFVVYRARGEGAETFPGHSLYDLAIGNDGDIRIRTKRTIVDAQSLRIQRRISIIL